ncbi:site-specific integrase [Paraburkholderia adhaesiva]|uniref:site-specific integrase n=1 Tax=Paraburkholderia adhaesiva TaxID=2883244 RepID=UPI001F264A1B|nr:site-specific integrase [Paraburkholderia adhaesiva]
MASITNRSRYTVSVKNNNSLYREFAYGNRQAAVGYSVTLEKDGYKPSLTQLQDTFLVVIRQKGVKTFNHTAASLEEAENIVKKIEEERSRGLFIDYTKAHQITFLDLLIRYRDEEGPKHKGWEKVEKYKINGWLEDAEGLLVKRHKQREAEITATGKATTLLNAMRAPARGLDWMKKSFAQITTEDIEGYIRDRLEVVAPSTVDRELDTLSAIFTVAISVWKYRVDENPMDGVRRPKYFNERDRRLKPSEEARLLAAARAEDRERCITPAAEALMGEARAHAATLPTKYQQKAYIKQALIHARQAAEPDYVHVPLYETFVQFQLMTAARRGETLNVRWEHVDLEDRSIFLPETKNGRPRKLPLRRDLMEMLETLPRNDPYVFPISTVVLGDAWKRILARAGIEDLHIHDLRHEAISRAAETAKFTLIDLQHFSGHRDVRMLLRYSHLCTRKLAERLDEAFGSETAQSVMTTSHHGRVRLKSSAGMSVAQIQADSEAHVLDSMPVSAQKLPAASPALAANVIAFRRPSAAA